ncbi:YbbR-like domain-containing protein [Desulforamulus ruminis]|uniref:CdaR family protein n=1 Tax=Desulforamulus ruminis TaxID=1564 RepID=UPI0023548135|nr:CdaR family protein [Desulforamulus ruminis]
MIRLKWSNNSMMLLSVLLALLLWVYVTIEENPVKEQDFRVELDTRGEVAQGVLVDGLPKNVVVRVQGKTAQLSGIRATDFQATVELGALEEGTTTRPVHVTVPSGLQVVQVNPARVNLTVEKIIQKQVPVNVVVKGEPASGYSALEPVVQPAEVLIKGSAKIINQLKSLEVTANIISATQNLEQVLMVQVPAGVSCSPDRVKVIIPVTRTMPSRVLPVVPRYSGSLPEAYQLVRAIVQPATVQVYAPVEVLNRLESIGTEAVRLDGITENTLKEVRLLVPEGVVDMVPGKVEVAIQVRPKQTQPETPPPDGEEPENLPVEEQP